MNYYDDPHDMKVMVAAIRRAHGHRRALARQPQAGTGHDPALPGREARLSRRHEPSDALLEDFALHFSLTVYHPTSTCRIGNVVDPRLRVLGVGRLRVADASVMPAVVARQHQCGRRIMIGEKAAEMIAAEHGVRLAEFVGERG